VIEKNGFFFLGLVGNENFVFLFFVSGFELVSCFICYSILYIVSFRLTVELFWELYKGMYAFSLI
jgi:hypothetical protein